jgi:hypothetical protein
MTRDYRPISPVANRMLLRLSANEPATPRPERERCTRCNKEFTTADLVMRTGPGHRDAYHPFCRELVERDRKKARRGARQTASDKPAADKGGDVTTRFCRTCGIGIVFVGKTTGHDGYWAHEASLGQVLAQCLFLGVPPVHPLLRGPGVNHGPAWAAFHGGDTTCLTRPPHKRSR